MPDAYVACMRPHPLLAVAWALASLTGCAVSTQAPADEPTAAPHAARPATDVKLARDVEPILMSGCSGEFCHRLTSASLAYSFLVNQPSQECDDSRPLVTPGDPDRSYLVDKILGRNLCAGHPMPRGFENRLTPEEIRTVTAWIDEGAPND
jgi:hypothetical protein